MVTLMLGLVVVVGLIGLNRWGRNAVLQEPAAAGAATAVPAKLPRAVVVDEVYALGVMNPGDERQHRFAIRNEGQAELILTLGSTTCKCTLAKFTELRIAPGGLGFIELEWHAEQSQFRFRQGAVIHSNDPANKTFELIGEGTVLVKLAALPETAYVADVPRNTSRPLSVLLYSQAFAEVQIEKIESTTGKSAGSLSSTPTEVAPPEHSRFHRDLAIELHPQAAAGHYDDVLRVAYVGKLPSGAEERSTFDLPVSFDVAGDVTLHGRDIVGNALVLGTLSRAKGTKRQFYVHVRGVKADELKPTIRRVVPDVLQVRIGEAQQLTPSIARLPILVELPVGTEPSAAIQALDGTIELATGREADPVINVPVSLVVGP